jgi:glucose dehydrogenase
MYGLKWILLGVFLIIYGLILVGIIGGSPWTLVAGICALIAGILFLINR